MLLGRTWRKMYLPAAPNLKQRLVHSLAVRGRSLQAECCAPTTLTEYE